MTMVACPAAPWTALPCSSFCGDIQSAKIDVVVVYKIDRLTRSLMDFAKIVDVFDAKGVSFVSVTQQFNTTTSMGRLTLNVLLSFAQFEREVTAERIRDKIAASKKKGMWMGGPCRRSVLTSGTSGSSSMKRRRRRCVVSSISICRSGACGSSKVAADDKGIVTKRRSFAGGRVQGGKPFSRGNLYQLLSNPIYVGDIAHKGQTYAGLHEAIVDRQTWDAVQATPVRQHRCTPRTEEPQLALYPDRSGLRRDRRPADAITCGQGRRSLSLLRLSPPDERPKTDDTGRRLPAQELERPNSRRAGSPPW